MAGQMTIVMHELQHVAQQSNSMDQSYGTDYENINQKCDPKDVPTEPTSGAVDLTGGTTP
jgi:hypothetical protein